MDAHAHARAVPSSLEKDLGILESPKTWRAPRGELASRLQAIDRKFKLSESFWPVLGASKPKHGPCDPEWGKT